MTRMDIANKPPGVHGRGNSERQEQIMNTFLYWLCMDLNELLLQRMQRKEQQFNPGPSAYI